MEIRHYQAQPAAMLSQATVQTQNQQGGKGGSGQPQSTIAAAAAQDNLSLSGDAKQLAQASSQQAMENISQIADQQQAQTVLGKVVSQLSANPKAALMAYGNFKTLNYKALLG